ncbi:hypothetical protein H0H93_008016 [Arthromyces matolae]|nr:hypothetical protein H0H93_008016 [Arthromyces matolae]
MCTIPTKNEILQSGWNLIEHPEVKQFTLDCWNHGDTQEENEISLAALGQLFPVDINECPNILVREWYRKLFQETQEYASLEPRSGIVVSGQPGVVRLLRQRRFVVFQYLNITYLFSPSKKKYRTKGTRLGNDALEPRRTTPRIFTLIIRIKLQPRYSAFEQELKLFLQGQPMDNCSSLPLQAAVQLLRYHNAEGITDSVDATGPSPTSSPVPMSLDTALHLLIDNAVRLYGPIPREVFLTVLHKYDFGGGLEQDRQFNSQLDLASLTKIIHQCQNIHFIDYGGRTNAVIRFQPIPGRNIRLPHSWHTSFKSDWVAKTFSKRMQTMPITDLKDHFYSFPTCISPIATQLCGMLTHLSLCRATSDYPFYMIGGPDLMSTSGDVYSGQPDGTLSRREKEREVIWVDNYSLPDLLKSSNPGDYFLPDPTSAGYPFYDAFFYEDTEDSINLYILLTTSACDHRDSNEGYVSIRDVAYFLQQVRNRKAAESPQSRLDVEVIVKYMFLCPFKDGRPYSNDLSWKMPIGWDNRAHELGINGDIYLLPIPIEAIIGPFSLRA